MSDQKPKPKNPLLGLFAVVGNWAQWETYFDLSRAGLRKSYILLLGCLPAIYLIAAEMNRARAQAFETPVSDVPLVPFFALSLVYLFSFAISAYLIAMLFDRQDRFRPWVIVRHWAVFALLWISALAFVFAGVSRVSIALPLGVGFAAYFGLLAIDIRLLMRVAGFGWQSAVLLACCIVAVGLLLLSLGLPN